MIKLSDIWNLRNYIIFVSIIGLIIILLNTPNLSQFLQFDVLLFLILCIIASNTSIQFKNGLYMTLTLPVSFFLLLSLNLSMAIYIGGLGILSFQIINKRGIKHTFFNIAQFAIAIFLTSTFLNLFYDGTVNLPEDLFYLIPSVLIFEAINSILASIPISFETGQPFKYVLLQNIRESQIGMPLYLTNGLIMFICYQAYGLWGLSLVIIPLFSNNWLLKVSKNADLHKEKSYICPTTGLKNRRCLDEWLENEFPKVINYNSTISFILIDIDDFKKINDQYGHNIGDQVLKEFGRLIKENIRDTDLIYRYGGEEFVIIFPGFQEEQANVVVERLHKIINKHSFTNERIKVTFSAGIAGLNSRLLNDNNMDTASELLRRADMAMYSAKQSGKDQTHFYYQ
ncbi:hypothetical protein BBF96_09815 [Anoxybacter fermentans]|uniref:GGDEF domain-containing protein n=1 Tax=Anoxybacter fermentans TaxID=1323375 RepID=A0A3Q9HRC8_9FIRM|nr:GGDEF domain-containing protein [Anoxybacter fermentans]AZR73656.1 hypothetical protein BBF96_09815 [Anoxybacter fermentans]